MREGLPDLPRAMPVWLQSGEQGRDGGGRAREGRGDLQEHAAGGGDAVDGGCRRTSVAVSAHVVGTQRIDGDDDDVGTRRVRTGVQQTQQRHRQQGRSGLHILKQRARVRIVNRRHLRKR